MSTLGVATTNMASTSGGSSDVHHTQARVSYHRSDSSTRSITVNPASEHLQTIQSGIPTGQEYWDNITQFRPQFRNDSMKGAYAGSVVNEQGFNLTTLRRGVGVCDSRKADVWRAAAVELVATAGFTFLSITAYQQGSNVSVASRAFLQAIIYSLAILAAAPISGGHLNPAITFTTFLTGQATFIRTILYIIAQCGGAIGGAAAVQFLTESSTGGCQLQALPAEGVAKAATLNFRQGLVAEAIFTIIMLFVVYGIGFDTRSVVSTFPIISPFIIGAVFGLNIFLSQGLGYTSAMNPARCLGPAVIFQHELWHSLCTFTIGPVVAAIVFGIFQLLVQQGKNAEFGPVLPLSFFQEPVVPDHQRPGYGPRSPSMYYPTEEMAHSQQLGPNFPRVNSSPGSSDFQPLSDTSKYSLTLQIKAFMQPKGPANVVDVSRFDQNVMLQQYSNSHGSSDSGVHHTGHPEKER